MENSETTLFLNTSMLDSPIIGSTSHLIFEDDPGETQDKGLEAADEFELPECVYEPLRLESNSKVAENVNIEVKYDAEDKYARKKRGRHRICLTEEQRKSRKAENNRKSAKANRERKKMYIERLETQIEYLRSEVDSYKARLSKYEIVEQHRSLFGYEIYRSFSRAMQDLYVDGKFLGDCKDYTTRMKKEMNTLIQERCKALEELTRCIVELSLPMPWRFLYWTIDNNVDILNLPESFETLRYVMNDATSFELAKKLQECNLYPLKTNKRKAFIGSVTRIRTVVKTIVKLQKEVQIELKKLAKLIAEGCIFDMTPTSGQFLSKFSVLLRDIPEVSDQRMYQLEDSDYCSTNVQEASH